MGKAKRSPQPAPGKYWRKGISWPELFDLFPDNAAAERWFVSCRWPDGVTCPECGGQNIQERPTRKPQPYRCRDCRKDFSVKSGTLMQGSPLGFRVWAIAIYILTTGIKGTSSMKLHRDLKVTQKTAWYLAHRIREAWATDANPGPVGGGPDGAGAEADESYFGGKEKNKHWKKKLRKGRGAVGKTAVAAVRDRETGRVKVQVFEKSGAKTLRAFVEGNTEPGTMVYTDEAAAYDRLPNHEAVCHGVGKYVDGQAHTNGLESFWSLMKRGYHGTYHRMSPKHLPRYVTEFAGRHNARGRGTLDQMVALVRGMEGKRLKRRDLYAGNGKQNMAE